MGRERRVRGLPQPGPRVVVARAEAVEVGLVVEFLAGELVGRAGHGVFVGPGLPGWEVERTSVSYARRGAELAAVSVGPLGALLLEPEPPREQAIRLASLHDRRSDCAGSPATVRLSRFPLAS